ncbi:uncharacterized protein NECHADRAFT_86221 [Fusarium vanettenii 77-13-4]|uniref:Uncharacterized protein n=1 Tax=Fusarium vanettenii (strain ATCC MYA-4622 / CBS 123669 / FGSC 9596 / NRRL 45880 / 77-13-4) TaxID=660122 RepID=C7ZKP1_FUSV7|nr:uncharacterized protein NECHADRAFT_86221 [Fusarium vanettenii 77-13-4]EEU35478.1 predicted protein [Fusarium vanettenii 77-13-4]
MIPGGILPATRKHYWRRVLDRRPNGKRPETPSPPEPDPKRPRTALRDEAATLSGSQENLHDLDNIVQPRNLNPLDQPSCSTYSNGNPEAIRPHLPFHQRDGEDASATLGESISGHNVPSREPLLPQHMLPQPLAFFLSLRARESIARLNEARLSMMIERIQRGQVEGFVFDREELAWTWEGMQDDSQARWDGPVMEGKGVEVTERGQARWYLWSPQVNRGDWFGGRVVAEVVFRVAMDRVLSFVAIVICWLNMDSAFSMGPEAMMGLLQLEALRPNHQRMRMITSERADKGADTDGSQLRDPN